MRSTRQVGGRLAVVLATLTVAGAAPAAAQEPSEAPLPVRNDVPRAGRELLVLRHQKLQPGSHRRFYEISRDAVWPFFEKIGTRVVGQWQVVHPEGGRAGDHDEGYRLARYRSFNHWAATRQGQLLGGNGPDYLAMRRALAERNELRLGSNGPVFLEGEMAPGGPYYMPGLEESYERVAGSTELGDRAPIPVRHGTFSPGRETLTLRHFKLAKGSFEELYRLSRDGVWPYFEKMGARIVGQWQVLYPSPGELEHWAGNQSLPVESPDYDEAYMLVRYASYEHWQATRPPVMARLGGNGPDYQACREALERRRALTLETSVQFLQGYFHGSPPVYLPALEERYEPRER